MQVAGQGQFIYEQLYMPFNPILSKVFDLDMLDLGGCIFQIVIFN